MSCDDELSLGIPELDYEDAREDFFCIWQANTFDMERIRQSNPEGGDYFKDDEGVGQTIVTVKLNIQGVRSNEYRRAVQGITSNSFFHCYALWDADIQETDMFRAPLDIAVAGTLIRAGDIFKIQTFNKSTSQGPQMVFQEFDILKIDKTP